MRDHQQPCPSRRHTEIGGAQPNALQAILHVHSETPSLSVESSDPTRQECMARTMPTSSNAIALLEGTGDLFGPRVDAALSHSNNSNALASLTTSLREHDRSINCGHGISRWLSDPSVDLETSGAKEDYRWPHDLGITVQIRSQRGSVYSTSGFYAHNDGRLSPLSLFGDDVQEGHLGSPSNRGCQRSRTASTVDMLQTTTMDEAPSALKQSFSKITSALGFISSFTFRDNVDRDTNRQSSLRSPPKPLLSSPSIWSRLGLNEDPSPSQPLSPGIATSGMLPLKESQLFNIPLQENRYTNGNRTSTSRQTTPDGSLMASRGASDRSLLSMRHGSFHEERLSSESARPASPAEDIGQSVLWTKVRKKMKVVHTLYGEVVDVAQDPKKSHRVIYADLRYSILRQYESRHTFLSVLIGPAMALRVFKIAYVSGVPIFIGYLVSVVISSLTLFGVIPCEYAWLCILGMFSSTSMIIALQVDLLKHLLRQFQVIYLLITLTLWAAADSYAFHDARCIAILWFYLNGIFLILSDASTHNQRGQMFVRVSYILSLLCCVTWIAGTFLGYMVRPHNDTIFFSNFVGVGMQVGVNLTTFAGTRLFILFLFIVKNSWIKIRHPTYFTAITCRIHSSKLTGQEMLEMQKQGLGQLAMLGDPNSITALRSADPGKQVRIIRAEDRFTEFQLVDSRHTFISLLVSKARNKGINRLLVIVRPLVCTIVVVSLVCGMLSALAIFPPEAAWICVGGAVGCFSAMSIFQVAIVKMLLQDFQIWLQIITLFMWAAMEIYMLRDERCCFVILNIFCALFVIFSDAENRSTKQRRITRATFFMWWILSACWVIFTLLNLIQRNQIQMISVMASYTIDPRTFACSRLLELMLFGLKSIWKFMRHPTAFNAVSASVCTEKKSLKEILEMQQSNVGALGYLGVKPGKQVKSVLSGRMGYKKSKGKRQASTEQEVKDAQSQSSLGSYSMYVVNSHI